ncbi:MAG: bifunctional folylpolyglutamate synthase/dihydrofolate synthase, partial [Acidobacteria bacterium]
MQFDEALRYLLSLGHETVAIKLGLRNIELLLDTLGNPQDTYSKIQIAGTNGKGSTAVVLNSICCAAGIRTGLYTSPHLVSITERVKIKGREISQDQFAEHATRVREATEMLLSAQRIEALPTFFEQATAIALLAFSEGRVELAILETGLGGRLDATTAAKARLVAITPIAVDHQDYLGETIESIAAEKAAIIRHGTTAIVAPQGREALEVIVQQCKACEVQPSIDECSARVEGILADGRVRVTFETKRERYENVLLGLRGRHQVTNVSVAIRLAESLAASRFEIDRSAIIEGIETASHAGRLEFFEGRPSFLFDGAHNPSGARALREYLDEFVRVPLTLIFGVMRDKDIEEMAQILFPAANHLILTQPDNPRAATVEMLERIASRLFNAEKISLASSVSDAIHIAQELTPATGVICVSGSLYLIGE